MMNPWRKVQSLFSFQVAEDIDVAIFKRFEEDNIRDVQENMRINCRFAGWCFVLITILRGPTHAEAGAAAASLACLLHTVGSSVLGPWFWRGANSRALVMLILHIGMLVNAMTYEVTVTMHRAYCLPYTIVCFVCSHAPEITYYYESKMIPIQIIGWTIFHVYSRLPPHEIVVEIMFGIMLNALFDSYHRYSTRNRWEDYMKTHTIKYERDRANAMRVALQTILNSQNDAECLCAVDGRILSSNAKLEALFGSGGNLAGLKLAELAAQPSEATRILRHLDNVAASSSQQTAQMLTTTLRGPQSGSKGAKAGRAIEVALYMTLVEAADFGSSSDAAIVVGFKVCDSADGEAAPDVGADVVQVQLPRLPLQSDEISTWDQASQLASEIRRRQNSHPTGAGDDLPCWKFDARSSAGSQASKLSVRSFWDALRLITGLDVRPSGGVSNTIENDLKQNGGKMTSREWVSNAFQVAHSELGEQLEERIERNKKRLPNREEAAACLAAAVIASCHPSTTLPGEDGLLQRVAEYVGNAGMPPAPEERRFWRDGRWLAAYARENGRALGQAELLQFDHATTETSPATSTAPRAQPLRASALSARASSDGRSEVETDPGIVEEQLHLVESEAADDGPLEEDSEAEARAAADDDGRRSASGDSEEGSALELS
eukprot:TRINITY_DN6540_c0_g2_i1.p1 TRINITY_DN6540_c0_g2~~TRINITY_DN6540_c0_g2_i1.p1  ORF type:complete len:661 (+),score=121.18 TRINITY_DN6540_c0_g2_i1:69-2051(+)